jgi:hypothetical protein
MDKRRSDERPGFWGATRKALLKALLAVVNWISWLLLGRDGKPRYKDHVGRCL